MTSPGARPLNSRFTSRIRKALLSPDELHRTRALILDDDTFPSNKYSKEILEALGSPEDALAQINVHLLVAYIQLVFCRVSSVWWKSTLRAHTQGSHRSVVEPLLRCHRGHQDLPRRRRPQPGVRGGRGEASCCRSSTCLATRRASAHGISWPAVCNKPAESAIPNWCTLKAGSGTVAWELMPLLAREMAELFGCEVYHSGGDETRCGGAGAFEHMLLGTMNRKGFTTMAWSEVVGARTNNTIIHAWRSPNASTLASQGIPAVDSPPTGSASLGASQRQE